MLYKSLPPCSSGVFVKAAQQFYKPASTSKGLQTGVSSGAARCRGGSLLSKHKSISHQCVLSKCFHDSSTESKRRKLQRNVVVLGNGAPGAEKQAIALAEYLRNDLGLEYQIYRTPIKTDLPPILQTLLTKVSRGRWTGYEEKQIQDILRSGLPDVIIASGRATVGLALELKRRSGQKAVAIQIQLPRVYMGWFDLIITPQHDFRDPMTVLKRWPNLVLTAGTLHEDLSAKKLLRCQNSPWREKLESYTSPKAAVLVGGSCKWIRYTPEIAEEFARSLETLISNSSMSLMITLSRRTDATLKQAIADLRARVETRHGSKRLFIYDPCAPTVAGSGQEMPNPYLDILHHCEIIAATPDSVSMISEALSVGKPLFIFKANSCRGKIQRFFQLLIPRQASDMKELVELSQSFAKEPPEGHEVSLIQRFESVKSINSSNGEHHSPDGNESQRSNFRPATIESIVERIKTLILSEQ